MKKIISVILCMSVLLSTLVLAVFAEETIINDDLEFAGGSGTEEDPYQVATPEQLNNVRNHLDANFIQINDIDMSAATSEKGVFWNDGKGWEPIGKVDFSTTNTVTRYQKAFNGVYNGNGYTIKNINIIDPDTETIGLFGAIYNAKIHNLVLRDSKWNLLVSSQDSSIHVGGIAGYAFQSEITNCVNYNVIDINASQHSLYVGGIVGYSCCEIDRCLNYGDITIVECNKGYCGGISGITISGYGYKVTNSANFGNITANINSLGYVGGILGNAGCHLKYLYNTGDIKVKGGTDSQKLHVGGIAGYMRSGITDCYNKGDIVGVSNSSAVQTNIGGICGCYIGNDVVSIYRCYNTGKTDDGGGIFYRRDTYTNQNYTYASYVEYCYSLSTLRHINGSTGPLKFKNYHQLSETELKQKESYVGFDFDIVWNIDPDMNDGMPYLRNIPPSKIEVSVNSIYSTEFETVDKISGIIVIALYDNENRLLEVKTYPATESIPATLDKINSGKYIKVMWWDSISSMKPICENRTIYV